MRWRDSWLEVHLTWWWWALRCLITTHSNGLAWDGKRERWICVRCLRSWKKRPRRAGKFSHVDWALSEENLQRRLRQVEHAINDIKGGDADAS